MRTKTIASVAAVLSLALGCASPVDQSDSIPGVDDGDGLTTSSWRHRRRGSSDASTPTVDGSDGGSVTVDAAPPPPSSEWLHTSGNHIFLSNNTIWHGRGANLHDPRSCNACAGAPSAPEVNRRMDELVSWGATFIRLVLESSSTSQMVTQDANYLAQIKFIVAHAAAKPNVRVMISLWVDPTFTSMGWPSNPATVAEWKLLATEFAKEPRVLFGLVNEPEYNFDHALDAQVWTSMNDTVSAIRAAETAAGGQRHIVAVQGTGGWARYLDYYVTHPITAGGGLDIAYEVHVYDAQTEFAARFENPSKTLPVIIGEFGPADGYMTPADCQALMLDAQKLEIPHLAWTFHMRCPPNLLVDNSNGGCGVNMPLVPSPTWGVPFKAQLGQPW